MADSKAVGLYPVIYPEARSVASTHKQKRRHHCLRFFILRSTRALPEPSCRMREQRIDQPGFRGEVTAQRRGSAILAGNLVEQPLELCDVAIHGLLEGAIGAVFAGDLVKSLLACRRIEPL